MLSASPRLTQVDPRVLGDLLVDEEAQKLHVVQDLWQQAQEELAFVRAYKVEVGRRALS